LLVADDLDGPRAEQYGYVVQAQNARLEALGLNTDSDLERSLGRRVVESLPDP